MARPVGSKNRPDARKPRRAAPAIDPEYAHIKQVALELIESEQADNLTEAAHILGINPTILYRLAERDATWASDIKIAQNIKADRLEADLDRMNNPLARIFRLKKLRPEYRDNFKLDFNTEALEALLKKLAEAGKVSPAAPPEEEPHA